MASWSEPGFTVMPLLVVTLRPYIDCAGRQFAAVMSLVCMSGSDGPLIPDNCKSLRNTHEHMQNTRTLSHTAPFYWNSWTSHIPAWKVNSCRLCCITHEGKAQQLLFLPAFPDRTKLVSCK